MSKRLRLREVLIVVGVLGFGLAMVFLARPRPPTYWAVSAVLARPCTNAFFARSFETQMIHSIPALRKLTATPGFSTPAAAASWHTNKSFAGSSTPVGANIRLMALGATPEEARKAADDAATRLCAIVQRQYGGSAEVIMQATVTGRWLFLFELKLRLARLLHIDI
jgi:hypothetical protein